MRLRLTVSGVDVEVSALPGAPLSSVLGQLRALTGHRGAVFVGEQRLPDDARLGVPPLTCGAVVSIGAPGSVSVPGSLLQLRVTGGPSAGDSHPLRPGTLTLGRGPGARIRLDDPDLSREHARLTVRAGTVCVQDLGSTNGTSVNGEYVGAEQVTLPPGSLLRAGESTLCLSGPDEAPAAVQADGTGRLAVNRPPRLLQSPPSVVVRLPAPSAERDNPKFPLLAMLIPLLIGAVMVRVMGSWTFALFMLLSPVMLGANVLSDKVAGRRAQRKARAAFASAGAAALARVTAGLAEEAALRRVECPDPAALLLTATGPRPRLWERRPADPDALVLRLGTADLPARLTVRPAGADESPQHPPVPAVPLTMPLREVGVLGLAGPRRGVEGMARHVLAQLAGQHSPRDLSIAVLCSGDSAAAAQWKWARWLPHLRPGAGQACDLVVGLTPEQVAVRVAELLVDLEVRAEASGRTAAGEWAGPATVLVLDGARALRSVAGVARLLAEGPCVGVYAICLAADPLDLPAECGATAIVTGAVGTRLQVRRTGHPAVDDAVADLVSPEWAERFARGLAPLRDATPDGSQAALPDSTRLLDLLGLGRPGATTAETIASRWRAGGGSTVALLGVAADGHFSVDLRRDGPHALIAGTTGAGKSELLQTLVASLATVNRPDELAFVLVDYKGGSAFADCAGLPHTVGLVTDLDGHLTARALASLDAELKRRERALRAAACKDLDDYLTAGSPGERLPRLVIVIDEFASLAQELPDFVTGLVDIARRGRSLGVHLVLATQRPAGVVSAEIRANTNLRVALRVTDPAESQDVIDTKAAALIGLATPGRACCRIGSGSVVTFQGARVAGLPPSASGTPATVRPLAWERAGDAPPAPVPDTADAGPTDLATLVEAVREAAVLAGIQSIRSPWLAPLPALVARGDLPAAAPDTLVLGLVDLPAEQARAPFTLDLTGGGHLLAAGCPGSGRTTLLRSVAGAIAADTDPADVHLFALDCAGGGLLPLAALPHCGAAVGRDEVDRGDRLLGRLAAEVARRQRMLAAGGLGSLEEQRARAGNQSDRLPWLVLLVDGWEGFLAAYDDVDSGRPVEALLGLLREGAAVGLRAVVAGDRTVLTGRVSSLIGGRLVLRMADPMDYSLAGLSLRQVPQTLRPGQGLIPGDPATEVQVALLCADPTGPAQAAELARLGAGARQRAAALAASQRPMRVEPLPERVPYSRLVAPADTCGPLWTAIGLGGDDLATVGVDLAEAGPAFLVAGPQRSGRSTALVTMARWCIEHGTPVATVTPRRSPLRDLPGVLGCLTLSGADDLTALLAEANGPLVVFADDAGELLDTEMEAVLCDLLQRADERPWSLVLAGVTDELITTYRGITMAARRNKAGLLISPSGPVDGEVLGVRLPRGLGARLGRGVLAVRGATTPVQVAS